MPSALYAPQWWGCDTESANMVPPTWSLYDVWHYYRPMSLSQCTDNWWSTIRSTWHDILNHDLAVEVHLVCPHAPRTPHDAHLLFDLIIAQGLDEPHRTALVVTQLHGAFIRMHINALVLPPFANRWSMIYASQNDRFCAGPACRSISIGCVWCTVVTNNFMLVLKMCFRETVLSSTFTLLRKLLKRTLTTSWISWEETRLSRDNFQMTCYRTTMTRLQRFLSICNQADGTLPWFLHSDEMKLLAEFQVATLIISTLRLLLFLRFPLLISWTSSKFNIHHKTFHQPLTDYTLYGCQPTRGHTRRIQGKTCAYRYRILSQQTCSRYRHNSKATNDCHPNKQNNITQALWFVSLLPACSLSCQNQSSFCTSDRVHWIAKRLPTHYCRSLEPVPRNWYKTCSGCVPQRIWSANLPKVAKWCTRWHSDWTNSQSWILLWCTPLWWKWSPAQFSANSRCLRPQAVWLEICRFWLISSWHQSRVWRSTVQTQRVKWNSKEHRWDHQQPKWSSDTKGRGHDARTCWSPCTCSWSSWIFATSGCAMVWQWTLGCCFSVVCFNNSLENLRCSQTCVVELKCTPMAWHSYLCLERPCWPWRANWSSRCHTQTRSSRNRNCCTYHCFANLWSIWWKPQCSHIDWRQLSGAIWSSGFDFAELHQPPPPFECCQ